jgi:hypothetical protein
LNLYIPARLHLKYSKLTKNSCRTTIIVNVEKYSHDSFFSLRKGRNKLSAYERRTWEQCSTRILSSKHRLGYGEQLWILGFNLQENGCLIDPFHNIEVFDPLKAPSPISIPHHYDAVPEMYCILSKYAMATEKPFSGELVSPKTLYPISRFELNQEETTALLQYSGEDFEALRNLSNPFFGRKLGHSDLSFEVWPLPLIPITIMVWRGDESLRDRSLVLFDRSVRHYLPSLVIELARLTVWRLRNILNSKAKWGYHQLADPD